VRKILPLLFVLFAIWLAYSAWPFVALNRLVRAAQAGDVAAVEQQVDVPALRRSLSGQIMQTYARIAGVPAAQNTLLAGIAAAVADPLVEKLMVPAAIAELIKNGWPRQVLGDPPADVDRLDWNAAGNIWQLWRNASYGVGEFRLRLPVENPRERQFRIRLALSGASWKLSGIDLPLQLQERLAREFMKLQGK